MKLAVALHEGLVIVDIVPFDLDGEPLPIEAVEDLQLFIGDPAGDIGDDGRFEDDPASG